MEERSVVSYCGYCDICDEVLEITGIRILKYGTARTINFAHEVRSCPNQTSDCPANGKCSLFLTARREWAAEAREIIAEELEEA